MGRKLTEDDKEAWKREADSVKKMAAKPLPPLPTARPQKSPALTTPKPPPLDAWHAEAAIQKPIVSSSHTLVEGVFHGVDAATVRRIKRGQMAIGARVDLHGMTQAEALEELSSFIVSAAQRNKRLVLVITGKGRIGQGGGVLKSMLPRWLNMEHLRPHILAFDTAQIADGGAGAFYVLLKRNKL